MIAPVIERNANGRYVYLPECKWLLWKASIWNERRCKKYEAGDYFIEAELDEIPVFIRENTLMIQTQPQNFIGESDITEIFVTGLVTDEAEYEYYIDNGADYKYIEGEFSTLTITVTANGNSFDIDVKKTENAVIPILVNKIWFEIYNNETIFYETKII